MDSNVIYRDPRLRRAHFRLIRQHAADGSFEVIFPEVVIREAVAKFRERAEAAYSKMASPGEDLTRLGLPTGIPDRAARAEQVATYEKELRATCSARGSSIASLPELPHDRLVDQAIAKAKPFNERGAGYRDALIWETVAALALKTNIAFITANHADFSDPEDASRPAPNLARDLVARSARRTAVTIYPDLRSFIDRHVPGVQRVVEEVNDRVRGDADFRHSLMALISESSHRHEIADTGPGFELPDDTESLTIEWFEPSEIDVEEAHALQDDDFVLELAVRGQATLDGFVPKWAYIDDVEGMSIEDPNWNEWYMWAQFDREVRLFGTVTYNEAVREAREFDVTYLEGASW